MVEERRRRADRLLGKAPFLMCGLSPAAWRGIFVRSSLWPTEYAHWPEPRKFSSSGRWREVTHA